MAYNIDERVVYPLFGVGRITALVTKNYGEPEGHMYYEVAGKHSTLWVPVDEGSARGLRRLTRPEDLAPFSAVLLGQPAALNPDFRQRQKDVREKLKRGTLQDICEVVRDLNGMSWNKPLADYDAEALRKSTEALCQEWAATKRVTPDEAKVEVGSLLQQARQAFQG